jgi:hypothetical protein
LIEKILGHRIKHIWKTTTGINTAKRDLRYLIVFSIDEKQ